MDGGAGELTVRTISSLGAVSAEVWDRCARPATPSADDEYNPFVTHAFLSALEDSGTTSRRTGWLPHHLIVERSGAVVGVVPAYVKSHSMGEYVFDHAWADAYERAGGSYYPKLQCAVPFTPVPGRRLLLAPDQPPDGGTGALGAAIEAVAGALEVSSAHVTFLTEAEWRALGTRGFLLRQDQQFHWSNRGYGTFDDFLADLTSRKRKMIARERRDAVSAGVTIERLSGRDVTEAHWDAFFGFYEDTGARKWGRPYLNRTFFSLLGERLGADVLLVMAKRAGRYVAGALNLAGSHALFGRNWGAVEHHPFLHFEVCYYQAIEHAILAGLPRVEAGAQGEHKLLRGYMPAPTYSAHVIADPRFAKAVEHYLERERLAVDTIIAENAAAAPFRKTEPGH